MAKIPNALVGIAGVHYVVSELSLRGLVALPTIRNTAWVDVLVYDPKTGGHASLQVKASQKKVSYWPTGSPEKCLKGPNAYYVFLRRVPDQQGQKEWAVFLEDANKVVDVVKQVVEKGKKRGKKYNPAWGFPASSSTPEQLAQKWKNWRP